MMQLCIASKVANDHNICAQRFAAHHAMERYFLLIHHGHEDVSFDPIGQVCEATLLLCRPPTTTHSHMSAEPW